MRAIRVDHFGAPDVLKLVETQAPQAAPGEVLVRVTAAGVNPVDWAVRSGSAGDRFGSPPYIPGWDICGVIEAAGPGTVLKSYLGISGRPRTVEAGHPVKRGHLHAGNYPPIEHCGLPGCA